MNTANYIKNQDDIQVVLHTVMFRGTPCIITIKGLRYRVAKILGWKIGVCNKPSVSFDKLLLQKQAKIYTRKKTENAKNVQNNAKRIFINLHVKFF